MIVTKLMAVITWHSNPATFYNKCWVDLTVPCTNISTLLITSFMFTALLFLTTRHENVYITFSQLQQVTFNIAISFSKGFTVRVLGSLNVLRIFLLPRSLIHDFSSDLKRLDYETPVATALELVSRVSLEHWCGRDICNRCSAQVQVLHCSART